MRKFAQSYEDHIHRYAFAMRHCYRRDVLDAGSKDGFGAQMLSWVANTITLADISEEWLNHAKKIGGYLAPANFILADFNKGFPEGSWDTVVTFEVIEHVDDPDFYIESITKALKPGGTLVFSVPHMVANHEHKTLFDEEKVKTLVSKHLTITEFYTQEKRYLSEDPLYRGLKCYVGVATKNENQVS